MVHTTFVVKASNIMTTFRRPRYPWDEYNKMDPEDIGFEIMD
jgi:hypothetical protein